MKNRISEMNNDIMLQVVEDLRSSPVVCLQLDESTDVSSSAQLLIYAGLISENNMNEQDLFFRPLPITWKKEVIFEIVEDFF